MHPRLQQLLTSAGDRGFDFVSLVPGPTLYYATGLTYFLSERPIVAIISS